MAKNIFFNNFENTSEQSLYEDLIIESIAMYGHDVYYVPRVVNKKDDVYREDSLSTYEYAYDTRLYIKSFDSYEGDGQFLSRFNIEVRDQITFSIARKVFINEIGTAIEMIRPLEGDLIYSKMMKRLFIIKYVNNTPIFYQLGTLQTWDLVCEVFEYSNEEIRTGIPEIDEIQIEYSFAGDGDTVLTDYEFENSLSDIFETNTEMQEEGEPLFDWSKKDPWSEGNV